jgi:hypothetical protein
MTNDRFRKFIALRAENSDIVPLIHTTPAFSFADIAGGDSIEPRKCKYFRKKLIYMFYGRPAMRTQVSELSRLRYSWPISFIINPSAAIPISSTYPFDTGAFFNDFYRGIFSEDTDVADFELSGGVGAARKLVGIFYGDAKTYLTGPSTKNDVGYSDFDFEAQGVHELSKRPPYSGPGSGEKNSDERSTSIELQTEIALRIQDVALGIVLPQQFMRLTPVVDALARWNIPHIETYKVLEFHESGSWIGQLYEAVYRLYERLGYLK